MSDRAADRAADPAADPVAWPGDEAPPWPPVCTVTPAARAGLLAILSGLDRTLVVRDGARSWRWHVEPTRAVARPLDGPPPEPRLELDLPSLESLLSAGQPPAERLGALLGLAGARRAAHGVRLEPPPAGLLSVALDRLDVTPARLGALLAAVWPARAEVVLALIDDARSDDPGVWTLRVDEDLHLDRRLDLRPSDPVDLARALRLSGDVGAALVVRRAALASWLAGGAAPAFGDDWAASTALEPEDLRRVLGDGVREGLGRLLAGWRARAVDVLRQRAVALRVRGGDADLGPLWVAGGRLGETPPSAEAAAGALGLTLDVGLLRRLLALPLAAGRRGGQLVEALVPPRWRMDVHEQALLLLARDGDGWRVAGGGEYQPGGVLWEGHRWSVRLDATGAPLGPPEGDDRDPPRFGPDFAHLGSLGVDWAEPETYDAAWGPGSLFAGSGLLARLLPGLRGRWQVCPVVRIDGAPADGRLLLLTRSGVRWRVALELSETRWHEVWSDGACALAARARAEVAAPELWRQLAATSGALDLGSARVDVVVEDDGLRLALPDGARLRSLLALATPLDSRGEVVLRLAWSLAVGETVGALVVEHPLDLRHRLPEALWADRVLRPRVEAAGGVWRVTLADRLLLEIRSD